MKKTSNSFFLADLESNISVLESILSSKISSEKEKNESCAFRWMKCVKPCLEDIGQKFFKPKNFKEGLDKLKEIHQSLKPKSKITMNFRNSDEGKKENENDLPTDSEANTSSTEGAQKPL